MNIGVVISLTVLPVLFHGEPSYAMQDDNDKTATVVIRTSEKQGFLGVSVRDMDADLAKKMKIKTQEGALVTAVEEGSPAEKAGILKDDLIVQFGGKIISNVEDLQKNVRKAAPGTEATVVVMRGGQKKSLKASVGKMPRTVVALDNALRLAVPRVGRKHFSLSLGPASISGLSLMELNSQLGEYFVGPNGRGVLVTEVENGSAGETAGFKAGDVIIHLGRETVEDLRDITDGFSEYKDGENVPVEILRRGERKTLSLKAEDDESLGWNPDRMYRWDHLPHDTLIQKEFQQQLQKVRELKELREAESIDLDRLKRDLESAKRGIDLQMKELRTQMRSLRQQA